MAKKENHPKDAGCPRGGSGIVHGESAPLAGGRVKDVTRPGNLSSEQHDRSQVIGLGKGDRRK